MTEQEKIEEAVDAIAITIEDAPPHIGSIIFQCNEDDLRFYRAAIVSESVTTLSIKRGLFLCVVSIEKGTMIPYLESLDNY